MFLIWVDIVLVIHDSKYKAINVSNHTFYLKKNNNLHYVCVFF